MVKIWSKIERWFDSFRFSRYAFYLIIQNADPRKKWLHYDKLIFLFKQEINEDLMEDSRRVQLREEMKKHNV